MSYPPGPNGPYGNNPYGQQPTQPQQPYGYPQQAPQSAGPGYGYPQQAPPGYAAPGGGMPNRTNAVKIMMIVVGSIQSMVSLTFILVAFIAGNSIDDVADDVGTGLAVIILFFALSLIHGAFGVLIGTQFAKMGNGGRTGSIVWASLLILFGVVGLAMYAMGIFWISLAVTCIVLLNAPESKAYFNRPRY